MNEEALRYLMGFAVGVFAVVVVRVFIRKKRGTCHKNYDERQKVIQGKAYKIGFFVMVLYFVVNGLACMIYGNWLNVFNMNFIGVCLGIGSYACYAIINDAYISIKSKASYYLFLFMIVAVINIGCYYINKCVYNEPDEVFITNLICGVTFAILFAVMLIKMLIDKHTAKKEML